MSYIIHVLVCMLMAMIGNTIDVGVGYWIAFGVMCLATLVEISTADEK